MTFTPTDILFPIYCRNFILYLHTLKRPRCDIPYIHSAIIMYIVYMYILCVLSIFKFAFSSLNANFADGKFNFPVFQDM